MIITGPVSVKAVQSPTAAVSVVSVTTGAAVTLLPANPNRRQFMIFSRTQNLLVKFGPAASTTSASWYLPKDTGEKFDTYTGIVTALGSGGTATVYVTEF